MKINALVVIMVIMGFAVHGQDRLNEQKISYTAVNTLLSDVLKDLEDQYHLSFTYGNTINLAQRVTISVKSIALPTALDNIFLPAGIKAEIVGSQIALVPAEALKFSISGVVKDSLLGSALPYALVRIKDSPFSTQTDFEGKFTLRNIKESSFTLVVSSFAYKPYEVTLSANGRPAQLSIQLSPETINLSETIVVSDKIIERTSVSQMELNQNQLQWSKGISGDPLNSLTALPGVLGRIDIYGTSNIHIRGGEPFENQFLLDNIRLSFPFYSIGQSVFNPDMLEKAEVLTGGYNSNYGQSMSSVFNLTTKTGDYQKVKGNVDLSFLNNSALIQGPLIKDKLSVIVGVRKNNLDLLNLNQHSRAFFMGDVCSKTTYILNPKTKLSLTTINVVDNLDFTHSPDFRLKLRAKNAINAQNFQVQSMIGDKSYSKTSVIHSGLVTSSKFGKYYYNTNNNVFGLREDLTIYLNPQSKIKTGFEFNLEDDRLGVLDYYRATDISITDTAHLLLNFDVNTRNTSSAVYAFYDGKIFKRLLLNVGGRVDYSQLNSNYAASPRVTLAYEFTRSTTLSGTWGVFNQNPVLYQLNQNKNLKPNTCQHAILALKQRLKGGFEARAEAYYKKYEDLVMFDKNLNFVNGGYGEAKGIELLLKREQGRLSGWISYAYAFSNRRRNLQDLEYAFYFDQRHTYNAIINYTRNNPGKNWILPYSYTLDFRYATGTPYTPLIAVDTLSGNHVVVAGAINSSRNPVFNNLNVKVTWLLYTGSKKQHELNFYIDLWNVLNAKNLVVRQYVVDKEEERINAKNNYAAGLFPNFGFRFNFNSH